MSTRSPAPARSEGGRPPNVTASAVNRRIADLQEEPARSCSSAGRAGAATCAGEVFVHYLREQMATSSA
jgi:hypothetical protein